MLEKVHKLKIMKDEHHKFVLTKAGVNSLYLFEIEKWGEFVEKLEMLPITINRLARDYKRFFMGNAFEVEVDAQQEIEIPAVLWEYLMSGKEDGEIEVLKISDYLKNPDYEIKDYQMRHEEYDLLVIAVKK